MSRLLTQNQKKKKKPTPKKQKAPNLKTQHGSAFFQHAETLNDLNERNRSLFSLLHPKASHAALEAKKEKKET